MRSTIAAVLALHATAVAGFGSSETNAVHDVVVLGGGFSGLYSALRLGQAEPGTDIVILEAAEASDKNGIEGDNGCLGGRIWDVQFDVEGGEPVWFGTGPIRVKSSQGNFFLAEELGFLTIESEDSEYGEAEGFIGQDRGVFFEGGAVGGGRALLNDQCAYVSDKEGLISEDWLDLLLALIDEKNVEKLCDREANDIHSMRQYITVATGSSAGYAALSGAIRFKSLWAGDAQGMLEWLDTDSFKSDEGWAVYPEGGMSNFIRHMYDAIEADHPDTQFRCGARVAAVDSADGVYHVTLTDGQVVRGKKVISTIPPLNLNKIGGNIGDAVNEADEAHVWHGTEVVTCAQQFEERWWEDKHPVSQQELTQEKTDTWYASDNCMQQIENFNSGYLRKSNTIRSLYVDDGEECAKYWKDLIQNTDITTVEKEINARHAEYFGTEIPMPLKTICKVWDPLAEEPEAAWYFLKTGATFKLGNNPSTAVSEWALQPVEGEDFFMCGSAFNVRHGWTDGARTSCDQMLHHSLSVPTDVLPQWDFSQNVRSKCSGFCPSAMGVDPECDFPERAILK